MADSATHKTSGRGFDPNPANLSHINANLITVKRNQSTAKVDFRQNMGNMPG
jgi:hypothetical protein